MKSNPKYATREDLRVAKKKAVGKAKELRKRAKEAPHIWKDGGARKAQIKSAKGAVKATRRTYNKVIKSVPRGKK